MKEIENSVRKAGRERRGQITPEEIAEYSSIPVINLAELLRSRNPQQRTIAARLIGQKRVLEFVPHLCEAIRTEPALYARIAMSEALGVMGEAAVQPLTNLLGKIGDNQERELPKEYFNKKSYPLARDLAARTLIKIGKPALPYLMKVVETDWKSDAAQQALDAIGGIVNQTNDPGPLPMMLATLRLSKENPLITWKIVRGLSGFKFPEAVWPLIRIMENSSEPAIRWEAARSLGQIGISAPYIIHALHQRWEDENREVRKAAGIALQRLK